VAHKSLRFRYEFHDFADGCDIEACAGLGLCAGGVFGA
jgi:hypothetical protein